MLDALQLRVDRLRTAVEAFPQVNMDLRIARLRLVASLHHDPDKTPVQGISSPKLRAYKPVG